jgi:hypothetical protein
MAVMLEAKRFAWARDHRSVNQAAGLGRTLQSCGDIHALSIDIVPLDDNVAKMHAYSERKLRISFRWRLALPGQRGVPASYQQRGHARWQSKRIDYWSQEALLTPAIPA